MTEGLRLTVVILLLAVQARADYSCLCNYASDRTIYTKPDTSSTVLGHMYEFDCMRKETTAVDAGSNWRTIVIKRQLGYIQLDSSLTTQTCQGSPSLDETLTTGGPTSSTFSTSTSSSPTSTLPTTTPTTTSSTTTTSTTTRSTTTTPTTTSSTTTTSITTNPKSTSVPVSNSNSRPSTPTQTTLAPTTTTMSTTLPTTRTPVTQIPTQASTTTTATQKPTTQSKLTQAPPLVSSKPITTYTCPDHVLSAAQYNHGTVRLYGTVCYEIVPVPYSWSYAENNCAHKGGHLVHISNANEENAVMKFLHDINYSRAVWIGLTDINSEEHFHWTSGDPVTYTKWTPGRKSNFYHHSYEDCVLLVPYIHYGFLQTYGQWDDVHCEETHPWICQHDAIAHVSSHSAPYWSTSLPPPLSVLHNLINSLIG